MAHSQTYEAIVLKTYDIGEADRLLILLTRERGRVSAKAKAVRKLQSRMGGHLLPFQHVLISLVEGRAGLTVTSVQRKTQIHIQPITPFLHMEQGIEILLSLLHEEESLPDVFELTLAFLQCCQKNEYNPVLPFTLKLLSLLGLLPDVSHEETAPSLTEAERQYVQRCMSYKWNSTPALSQTSRRKLSLLCRSIIADQTNQTLRATPIVESLTRKE